MGLIIKILYSTRRENTIRIKRKYLNSSQMSHGSTSKNSWDFNLPCFAYLPVALVQSFPCDFSTSAKFDFFLPFLFFWRCYRRKEKKRGFNAPSHTSVTIRLWSMNSNVLPVFFLFLPKSRPATISRIQMSYQFESISWKATVFGFGADTPPSHCNCKKLLDWYEC